MNHYILRVYYPVTCVKSEIDSFIEEKKEACLEFLPYNPKILVIDSAHHDEEARGFEWNLETFIPYE